MKIPLIDKYSDEEFKEMVKNSNSFAELMRKLGYSYSSASRDIVMQRMNKLNISIDKRKQNPVLRKDEEIFIKNSPVDQKVLRNHYKNGNYSKYICSICGQEPNWNEKELTLILDHIDGNNKNDELNNLRWVCPNCNSQLDTTGSRNNKFKNPKIPDAKVCIKCGKELKGRGKTDKCNECANKELNIKNQKVIITRDELKELIRTTPFLQIGKMFDVSDNAIRKHCKKYNLPYKSKDIKSYSDEEWEKI